jgi:predicted membrane-bound dolichyl-phosphate-mannose-protein mannosyltransferase
MNAKDFMEMNRQRALRTLKENEDRPRSQNYTISKAILNFIDAYEVEVGFENKEIEDIKPAFNRLHTIFNGLSFDHYIHYADNLLMYEVELKENYVKETAAMVAEAAKILYGDEG